MSDTKLDVTLDADLDGQKAAQRYKESNTHPVENRFDPHAEDPDLTKVGFAQTGSIDATVKQPEPGSVVPVKQLEPSVTL